MNCALSKLHVSKLGLVSPATQARRPHKSTHITFLQNLDWLIRTTLDLQTKKFVLISWGPLNTAPKIMSSGWTFSLGDTWRQQ